MSYDWMDSQRVTFRELKRILHNLGLIRPDMTDGEFCALTAPPVTDKRVDAKQVNNTVVVTPIKEDNR